MTPNEWDIMDVMKKFPRVKDEELTAYFDRVLALVEEENSPRLPYRDPREPGQEG